MTVLQGKDVADDDVFVVNLKFEDKHKRVKINQIQLKETVCSTDGCLDQPQSCESSLY